MTVATELSQLSAIDWPAVTDEAVRLLGAYLRIDTSNPPGNEAEACAWLAGVLDAEGVPYRTFDPGDGRLSLAVTLRGDASHGPSRGAPLVLLSHVDVVPVERAYWSVDPFAGELRDGYLWGRGAIDMKGMGLIELMVLLLHHRLGLPLRRDLTLLAVADEEAGGLAGIEFLDRAHPDVINCACVINEGGSGTTGVFGVERPVFQIAVAEKSPLWLRLRTSGTSGHGSVPHHDSAIDRLVAALARVAAWERPMHIAAVVQQHFDALHHAGVLASPATAATLRALATDVPRVHSMITNSVAVTSITAGVRHNVIPSQAEATLDVRLVPEYRPEEFIHTLRAVIADPLVEIDTVFSSSTPVSPVDTEAWTALAAAAREHVPDAVVVPGVSTGFTDSRVFRRRGIPAYGFSPLLLSADEAGRTHGTDERISVANLRLGMQILLSAVRHFCG